MEAESISGLAPPVHLPGSRWVSTASGAREPEKEREIKRERPRGTASTMNNDDV